MKTTKVFFYSTRFPPCQEVQTHFTTKMIWLRSVRFSKLESLCLKWCHVRQSIRFHEAPIYLITQPFLTICSSASQDLCCPDLRKCEYRLACSSLEGLPLWSSWNALTHHPHIWTLCNNWSRFFAFVQFSVSFHFMWWHMSEVVTIDLNIKDGQSHRGIDFYTSAFWTLADDILASAMFVFEAWSDLNQSTKC